MKDRNTRHVIGALLAVAAALVAACGGGGSSSAVGDGVKPSYLVVFPTGSATTTKELDTYECQEGQLRALLYFTDGSVGDFTNRVVWSTAAPGVAAVSNGSTPVPNSGNPTLYYSRGVVLPASSGTTVITADYQGIKGSIRVNVGTPTNFTITDQNLNTISSPLRLGTGTSQQLKVLATLDGARQDMSSFVYWSFDNGGNSAGLTVSSSGLVTGVGPTAAQTLRMSFPTCSTQLTLSVADADIKSVSIQRERPGTNLMVGNYEELTALGDFGDGTTPQDISNFVTFNSSNSDTIGALSGTANNLILAGQAGTVTITATATLAGQTPLNSTNFLSITAQDGTLQSLTVSPVTATLKAGSVDKVQFSATGTYGLADGTQITQDITRIVTWSADNNRLATISSAPVTAGQAGAVGEETGNTTITATQSSAVQSTTASGTLTLQ